MKRCPTCSRVYDDLSLRFCLDDGTELVNKVPETAPATAVLPSNNPAPTIEARPPEVAAPFGLPPTVTSSQPTKRSVIPWVLGGALLLVLGLCIAIAFLWLVPKQSLPWHLVLQVEPGTDDRSAVVRQTVSIIERRLNAAGVPRFEVRPDDSSSGRILVNLPGLPDPERIKNLISSSGKLELVHVLSSPNPAPVQTYTTKEEATASMNTGAPVSGKRRVLPEVGTEEIGVAAKKWVVVESPAIVDGSDLSDASAVRSSTGDSYDIVFSLKKFGAEKFGTWTSSNINNYLGVVLNDEVKSIAFIRSPISDQGVISGRFSKKYAEDLALVLRSGALPAPVKFVEERVDR